VVKGTQFRVSVNATSTSVDVLRGQVEVADFKSGQIAQVMPGQHATAFAQGKPGLTLSGPGTLNPIEQGKPRPSSIDRIMVPKTGLTAPRSAANGQQIHALGHLAAGQVAARPGTTRISAALGEVTLNFNRITHGLAHRSASTSGSTKRSAEKDTIWSSREAKASMGIGNGNSSDTSGSASAAAGTGAASNSGVAAQVTATTGAAVNSGNGNGNANGVGANGNGNANANGNGNANGMVTATPTPTATTRNSGSRQKHLRVNRRQVSKELT